ncbi:hypothetical protein LSAT2_030238 [Lamellibrachia satsuma]|nr:hypothetical protein LSAT2_030238 [Lamellibrachia satsuma]
MTDAQKEAQEELEVKAIAVLDQHFLKLYHYKQKLRRLRRITTDETPWRAQLNLMHGLCSFDVLLAKLEFTQKYYNRGQSFQQWTTFLDPEWFTMETAGTMVVAGKANVSLQHLPSGDGAEKSRSEISKKSMEQPVCSGMQVAAAVATGNFSILANKISDFFESVTKDFPPLLPVDEFLPPGADTTVPDAYIINVDEVAISLSRIKMHKATGPDEIPNWILHDYAAILAPPVCTIFNSSLREGTAPALWKCADVRPVPKIRPPALIEKDLCPISLTPVLSKCLEKLMCTWIMDITMDQIDPQQYGSIKGTSTVHALVELVHKWKYAVKTPGTIVQILFVDFNKAFDRVDHHILMTKCASLGLPTFITKWLTSFLCQRKQRVKIGSVKLECTIWEASSSSGMDSSLQVAADEVGQ